MTENEYQSWEDRNLLDRKVELSSEIQTYQDVRTYATNAVLERQKAIERINEVLRSRGWEYV